MKSFEYNFRGNGSSREFFGCFSFEPENIYEKRAGNLYMIGSLSKALPDDQRFLADLAGQIKEKHYKSKYKTPEKSLNESLQYANSYLEQSVKDGNTGWMGNLSFAAFAVRNLDFYFTRTEGINIFLLRQGAIVDLVKDIEVPEVESYPLRVFGNLISGKLEEGDAIMAATKGVGEFIKSHKLGPRIAAIVAPEDTGAISNRDLEQIFSGQPDIAELTGSCLIISLRSDISENVNHDFCAENLLNQVAMREMFKIKGSAVPKFNAPRFKFPKIPNYGAAIGIAAVLAFGIAGAAIWYWFDSRARQAAEYSYAIGQIRSLAQSVDSPDIAAGDANASLQASLDKLAALAAPKGGNAAKIAAQAEELKNYINEAISRANKEERLPLASVFMFTDFTPLKMLGAGGEFYFFNPDLPDIYQVGADNAGKLIPAAKFTEGAVSGNVLFFYSKPGRITTFKSGAFLAPFQLKDPYANANFDHFYTYGENLYFVDKTAGAIVKYPHLGGANWGLGQMWLSGQAGLLAKEASMAFDRNAWVLNRDGSVDKYFTGKLETSFKPDYLPAPSAMEKIITSVDLPYLYLMESSQHRIVVLDKDGRLVKQLVADQMRDMLDFAVSDDGSKIYVLAQNQLFKADLIY